MPQRFSANVIQTLAEHLGVPAREILLTHDLYRDWGFTPLALVVMLLDLEKAEGIELPLDELGGVRTVADLVLEFRSWVRQREAPDSELVHASARAPARRKANAPSTASSITCAGSNAAPAPAWPVPFSTR